MVGSTRIFTSERFDEFCKGSRIADEQLIKTVEKMEAGSYNAHLGGGLFKERLARKGGSKSGGFRLVLVFKMSDRAVFVFGFAKNVRANLTERETFVLKEAAKEILNLTADELQLAVLNGKLREVMRNE